MFWSLLLSHLVADYPLQTDAMVQAKKTAPGLTAHVGVHLFTMLAVLSGLLNLEWQMVWPYVLAVTLCHFGIDTWKNVLSKLKPQWVIGGYLQDQVLHLISILLVAFWAAQVTDQAMFAIPTTWVIYGSGYVLVSHAAFVTERVLSYQAKAYQHWVGEQMWPRMMSRMVLYSAFLIGWNVWGGLAVVGSLLLSWFDLAGPYRWWALAIDLGVVAVVILLTQGVMG